MNEVRNFRTREVLRKTKVELEVLVVLADFSSPLLPSLLPPLFFLRVNKAIGCKFSVSFPPLFPPPFRRSS